MKTRAVVVLLGIVVLTKSSAAAPDVLYVRAARLITDVAGQAVSGGAIVIADGVVAAAGTNIPVPDGARHLDVGALTVMPSLIDAHTHLAGGSPTPQPGQPTPIGSPAYSALRAQKSVDRALRLGVAAMRDLASSDFIDVAVAEAIDDGTIPGPHLVPAAHALSIIGGHEDFTPSAYTLDIRNLYDPLHGFVSSAADVEKAVQLQIKFGAKVIKLMASGGVGSPLDSPKDQNLTLDEMRVAVEQAHMHHLKVAAHAQNLQSIMDAMRAGVDSIEHGTDLDQEAVDLMKSHHVVYVPTLRVTLTSAAPASPGSGGYGASAYSKYKAQQLVQRHMDSFALALRSGVAIAAGSDTAYPPDGTGVFAEVVTEVEHGMPARAALEAATTHGAALLGLDKLGALVPGMEGDLIAVDGDPLTDIHALERVRLVVYKGRIVTDLRGPQAQPSTVVSGRR